MDQARQLRDLIINKATLDTSSKKTMHARVITVSSGKGGVGKSNFSVNLAVYLAKLKKRVLVIDADFGLANIEVLLNVRPEYNFYHLVKGKKVISEVMIDTQYGIKFISGGNGLTELANINSMETDFLIDQFEYLDKIADIIIIDTGAGISKSVTNFISASDEPIIVTTPEPTSFTDAYTLMKIIKSQDMELKKLKVIVNKCDDQEEADRVFHRLNYVCTKFLGLEIEHLGSIPLDVQLIRAVKQQRPAILLYEDSDFSKAIVKIGNELMNTNNEQVTETQDGVRGFMKKLVNIFGK